MNLILTMAGKYARFVYEGYKLPKYLLPWGRKSILATIISELNKEQIFENVYLIASKRDEIYAAHIRDTIDSLGIPIENLFLIANTNSQTQTAYIGICEIEKRFGKDDKPVVFHNIDTILYNRNLSSLKNNLQKYDGFIDIFKSNNHSYSYVLLDGKFVTHIEEKIVISELATSGFYGFSSGETFKKFFKGQDYISKLYCDMIDSDRKIIVGNLHEEKDTVVLGTPSDYLTNAYILDLQREFKNP